MQTWEEAERLGTLYDKLYSLIGSPLTEIQRKMSLIVQEYGQENVAWMLEVIKEDLENAKEYLKGQFK